MLGSGWYRLIGECNFKVKRFGLNDSEWYVCSLMHVECECPGESSCILWRQFRP